MKATPHLLIAGTLLIATWTQAADLWVGQAPSGQMTYPSVQAALDAAGPGDVVRLSPGVYRERVVFKQSGTEDNPVTLEGNSQDAIIDGSTPVEFDWQPAPDIGPGVYRTHLNFVPFTVTANGQTITTLDEKRTTPKGGSSSAPAIDWKEAFVKGVGSSGWDGVRALAMYRAEPQELLIRFKDELDPRYMDITVAPREAVVSTNGQDYCTVRNLTLRNAAIGAHIVGSKGAIVERCVIDPADYGVVLDDNAQDAIIRNNRISLSPYAGADPWRYGAWDNWKAMKTGGFYDRIGIRIRNTLGGHDIHDNYIHDHWDGIDDHANTPWNNNFPDANPNLRVHHNLIRNLNDDALETMGPSVDGQWHDNLVIRTRCGFRIKAPQKGPLYIYRNIFLDNKEDLRNWGQGEQFYPDVTVWVYHNTSTSDTAVNMNYHNLVAPLSTPNYHYMNNLFWCRQWIHSSDDLPLPDWQTEGNVFILANQEYPRPWDAERDNASAQKIAANWQNSMVQAAAANREIDSTWVGDGPPGFTDPENYDLSLSADSPARSRGIDPDLVADEPLPGCEFGYFSDIDPDAGAIQYGQPMPEIPRDMPAAYAEAPVGQQLVVLVGDSTVTGKSKDKDQAGWGWALQHWAQPGTYVENTAVGGRSSRSFRTEGRWDKAMAMEPDWVLIQFGHNDQPGKGPERESAPETDFRDHLRRYVREAREQGAKPILVSPVCRRVYHSNGTLSDSLDPYAEAVLIVAEEMQVPCLDLHQLSYDKFSELTAKESLAFSPTGTTDKTHFSTAASVTIAQWVLELMQQQVPELAADFKTPENVAGVLPISEN